MLEENNGLSVRLEIYNLADSQTKIKSLYPMGAKFTIREPILSIEYMLSFSILINNPANFQMHVTKKEKSTESMLHVDEEELRKKSNIYFTEKR